MAAERLLRILELLAGAAGATRGTRQLCAVAAEVTRLSGAGIMLLADEQPQASLCTTDDVSSLIETLQYALGEGPCIDAHRHGTVVAEPDLADPSVPRWTAFSSPAVAAGARAVFGFPIRIGSARLGALNLYRDRPGPLDADQHADALVLAAVVARAILAMQADARSGQLPWELEGDLDLWVEVNQAAGMISVQIACSVAEALVRLRAFALRAERPIVEVARDVVERRLRFDNLR